jgi:phosphoribosyl-ATP pyrophosphohydrolase/phosphoribosyl-AMP cyclohydrolase
MTEVSLPELKYDAAGLIPAVVCDCRTGAVLMVAYMNSESLAMTMESGYTHFWSRSRQKFWKKGETSGHLQRIREIRTDCDRDTLLVQVEQTGPACHTGSYSCFFRPIREDREGGPEGSSIIEAVYRVVLDRKHRRPEGSYVAGLMEGGREKILAKVLEEAGEVAEASREGSREEIVHEVADLWFHTLVLLGEHDIAPSDIFSELSSRYQPDRDVAE